MLWSNALWMILLAGILGEVKTNRLPQFSQEKRAKSIDEQQPIGTFILRSTATDYEGDEIVYSIEGDENGFFQINPKNGDLKTAKVIDKESLENNVISFKIVAAEGRNQNQKSYQKVDVIINDINDNPPVFLTSSTDKRINLTENASGATFVTQIQATDKDKSNSQNLFYTISKGNEDEYFKMNLYDGKITTTKPLDYEVKSSFKLEIIAMDGRPKSKGVHKVKTNVFISVIDEDDNGAKFDSNYSKPITEGEYKGHKLLRVHAEDQDKGINSPVTYTIEPASNRDGIFSINRDGDIFVNGIIDRERTPVYNLELRALEDDESRFNPIHPPAKATLTITVDDINDNPPVFTSTNFVGHVMEHEEIGFKVVTVKAIDKDEGKNAEFVYRLTGKDAEKFSINNQGEIFVQGDTDRESKYLYRFKVEAIQEPHDISIAQVDIIVHDKNDHRPIFSKTNYVARIPENSPTNITVIKVLATDRDEAENGAIIYSIEPQSDGLCFHIHPKSGVIRLRCQVDREHKDRYDFLVTATDQSKSGPRSNQAQVQVYIEDQNDNYPEFKPSEYFKSINYDEFIGTTILNVKAFDKDDTSSSNNFGRIWYRIVDSDSVDKFAIKKETGAILVGSHLSDTSGTFFLEVEAFDNEGQHPTRRSIKNAKVTITIEEKGENSVVLLMKAKTAIVVANEDLIADQLKYILDYNIKVDAVEAGSDKSTKFIFHAFRKDNYKVVAFDEIIVRLKSYQGVRMDDFMRNWNITDWYNHGRNKMTLTKKTQGVLKDEQEGEENQTWTPIIYAVLGFSALIVIFGIIGILYLIRSRRRYIDGGASLTSSRVPITARGRTRSYWNDPGFESVSQINTESYVHSSGFLSRSVDKYELDPSNMYNGQEIYNDDPFSVIIDRPPSQNSNSSHGSSGFAASSVMTVYRAPNMVNNPTTQQQKKNGDSQPLLRENSHKKRAGSGNKGPSPRDRKLSVIVDEEGNSRALMDPLDHHHRPPSYEYDFDTKATDGSYAS